MIYFGCWMAPGHYFYDHHQREIVDIRELGCPVEPGELDGGRYLPHDHRRHRQGYGLLTVLHSMHKARAWPDRLPPPAFPWTVLAFWDRTGDRRPGSLSAFVAYGELPFERVCATAERLFPEICLRQTTAVQIEQGSDVLLWEPSWLIYRKEEEDGLSRADR